MSSLPFSRVVNVNVSRTPTFPTRRGFGTPLFLTSTAINGVLDANNRTRAYGSIDEVAADHATASDFFEAATVAFAQENAPIQIKAGFYDATSAADAAGLQSEMNAIRAFDDNWYQITHERALRDTPRLDGLVEWTEARPKILLTDSNDANILDPSDDTNIAARHENTVERTAVQYHSDADEFLSMAAASYMATRNLDQADSAYTLKFKDFRLISPIDTNVAEVTAISSFIPELGQNVTAGHNANTYVDIGGTNNFVEGSTLTPNVFIDEIHATDFIRFRTEEAVLAILRNNARIPYTNEGMQLLAAGPRQVVSAGIRAGFIDGNIDPLTGAFSESVQVVVPSVFDVPESQRRSRVSPAITIRFRYKGAVHYTTINFFISF